MHVKDKVLGNVLGGTFSDSFGRNLSLYPHCQDMLQSASCQIWDFLPSSWGSLLTFRIFEANDELGFSGD